MFMDSFGTSSRVSTSTTRTDNLPQNKYTNRALNPFLPPRPKKPDSSFSIFMKDYSAQLQQNGERTANTRFVNVARAEWNRLSDERKQEYNARAQAQRGNKKKALELWYKMRNMLRRPPNAYCMFTKEMWANKDPNDQSTVSELSTQQSETWRGMDCAARAPYVERAAEALARYQQMYRTLRVGGNIIPFLDLDDNYEQEQNGANGLVVKQEVEVETEAEEVNDVNGDN